MPNKLKTIFYSAILFFSINHVNAQRKVIPPDLDNYIAKVLATFDVPGISVAIVKDGKAILTKGYGIKKLGTTDAVDENTLFCIASNSKAFTSTAMALLVDEGKVKWDDRVVDYLPWFKLSDDYVTAKLTIRDLFVHQSGLPLYANDILLFPPSSFTRKELLMKIRDVKLRYDFRSVYAYDNILYLAAGEVIEKVSGKSWEDFVKTRIFDVLSMKNSVSRFSTLRNQPNVAYSHVKRDGKLQVVDTFFDQLIGDASNPAGGIASSAADMSKWLITQLDSGRTPDKTRLYKSSATKELWKIVRPMPIATEPEWLKPAQKHFSGYGLGFRTSDYRGHQIVVHGGLLTGFVSQIALIPELNLGISVLTNQSSSGAYWAIINHIIDYNLKAQKFDWIAGYKKELDIATAKRDSTRKKDVQVLPDTNLRLSLPLEKYAGSYVDGLIGDVTIVKAENGLSISFLKSANLDGNLVHFHGDLFKLNYKNVNMGDGPFVSFSLNPDRSIREVRFITKFTTADGDLEKLVLNPQKKKVP